VRLSLVKLGTDFGTAVEVLSGLSSSDRIVVNPADSLSDGDIVTVADEAVGNPQPAAPTAPQGKG
jgi:hypothetical protein